MKLLGVSLSFITKMTQALLEVMATLPSNNVTTYLHGNRQLRLELPFSLVLKLFLNHYLFYS